MKRIVLLVLFGAFFMACSSERPKTEVAEKELNAIMKEGKIIKGASSKGMISSFSFGSEKMPIRFYFTQVGDEEMMREKCKPLFDFLKKETHLHFEMHIPKSYDEMIEAFGKDEAHIALMNSLSFVKAKEAFGVSAELKTIRFRSSSYFGQIIARADLGIDSVLQLQGRTMAYTDLSSASGYLYPKTILHQNGVKPSSIRFTGSHTEVVRMVYNGEVDAGATFYSAPDSDGKIRDARARLLGEYEDVAEKVKVVTVTRPIPNDPIAFGRQMNKKLSYEISTALIKFMSTPEAKTSLYELYDIDGFVRSSDTDYKVLQEAMMVDDSLASLHAPTS